MTVCMINTLRDGAYIRALKQTIAILTPDFQVADIAGPKLDSTGIEYVTDEIRLTNEMIHLAGDLNLVLVPLSNTSASTTILSLLGARAHLPTPVPLLVLCMPQASAEHYLRLLRIMNMEDLGRICQLWKVPEIFSACTSEWGRLQDRVRSSEGNPELSVFNKASVAPQLGPVDALQQFLAGICHDWKHLLNIESGVTFEQVVVKRNWLTLEQFMRDELRWLGGVAIPRGLLHTADTIAALQWDMGDGPAISKFEVLLRAIVEAWGQDYDAAVRQVVAISETRVYRRFQNGK